MDFAPSAEIGLLKKRAQLLQRIRAYFDSRGVMEVSVPCLGRFPVTDPRIECLRSDVRGETWFLQSSPEYYMKRLLAAGAGSIYSLGPAFRAEELGQYHRSEFTMLEWYRPGWTDSQLMEEVIQIVSICSPGAHAQKISYSELFEESLGFCPHSANIEILKNTALERTNFSSELPTKSDWLDLLFTHCIEPGLSGGLVLVYDYPKEQSALARVATTPKGIEVAKRFECYWNGFEIANGYWELTDADEQRQRFESDQAQRAREGKFIPALDEALMSAMQFGLPECAGVAMGVDRLMMAALGEESISSVMAFSEG